MGIPFHPSRKLMNLTFCRSTSWPHIARYCDTVAAIPISRDALSREVSSSPNGAIPPLGTQLHTGTSVRYPILQHIARLLCDTPTKRSAKEFSDTIAGSIARYDTYRCWASKSFGCNPCASPSSIWRFTVGLHPLPFPQVLQGLCRPPSGSHLVDICISHVRATLGKRGTMRFL